MTYDKRTIQAVIKYLERRIVLKESPKEDLPNGWYSVIRLSNVELLREIIKEIKKWGKL